MTAGEFCTRETVVVSKTESIQTAIELMRRYHVGDVLVVEQNGERTVPIGVLTDRDIVLEILGQDIDLDAVAAGDVMSAELIIAEESTHLVDVIKLMRDHGIRRLPVVDDNGSLTGILSVDDLLGLLAEQLTDIVTLFAREQKREKRIRPG